MIRSCAARPGRRSRPRRRRVEAEPAPPDQVRAQVARHDHDGVLEVDRAALAVGEPAVVEHLEQDVEHVRVRLLDLVEQQDRVRGPAHRLGELARLVVADVAGRRADQPADGVPLLELAHVDADHPVLAAEQRLGQRPGQLGLADAGRAEEQEAADRPVRVAEPGPRAADRLGDGRHRVVLADDPLVQVLLELEQPLLLLLGELRDRDAGRARDDLGDVGRRRPRARSSGRPRRRAAAALSTRSVSSAISSRSDPARS